MSLFSKPKTKRISRVLNYHACCIGATQTGKTTTALKLLNIQPGLRIFVNTKGEKWSKKYFHYICYSVKQFMEVLDTLQIQEEFTPLIMFVPDLRKDGKDINEFLKELYNFHVTLELERTTVLVDETHIIMSKQRLGKWLSRYWTMGLSQGLFGIAVAQRAQMIHNDILHNSEVFLIHQIIQQDIDYLDDKGSINSPDLEKLNFLPQCNRIHRNRKCKVSHTFYIQFNAVEGLMVVKQ